MVSRDRDREPSQHSFQLRTWRRTWRWCRPGSSSSTSSGWSTSPGVRWPGDGSGAGGQTISRLQHIYCTIANKNIFNKQKYVYNYNSFPLCEVHSYSTHILLCSPVSCDFYLTSNLLWVRSKNLTWAMALLMLLTHIFGPGHRYT